MSIEILELYKVFEESLGKEKAQTVVKDITSLIDEGRQELVKKENLKETELKLTREIEEVRLNLTREIEEVRKEIKEIELKLTHEINNVKLDIEKVRSSIIKWVAGLLVAQTGAIATLFMLLK